ncbi:hypothetical protein [Halomicronema sp. CCY15110]|nr:hypothetical protein [Halomicronema sp. CCY15110]
MAMAQEQTLVDVLPIPKVLLAKVDASVLKNVFVMHFIFYAPNRP